MKDENHFKQLAGYLIAGIFGLVLLFLFYPQLDDLASIQIAINKEEVKQRVAELVEELQYDLNDLAVAITFKRNNDLLKFAQKKYGLAAVARLGKNDLPSYYWHVEFTKKEDDDRVPDSTVVTIGSSSSEESSRN